MNINKESGKGAGSATATQNSNKSLSVIPKAKGEEITNPKNDQKPDNGQTVVNVNVTNSATSEAKAEATATAKNEVDIYSQIAKYEKLGMLMKQRRTLSDGREKIVKILSVTNEANPLQVKFGDAEFEADEFTFYNENLVRKTADFVIGEFNSKLKQVENDILAIG